MATSPRPIQKIIEPQEVLEGAGVRLRRTIGTRTLNVLDPFLLLDHFASTDPEDYQAGFPMHPHRGIETVTYVLEGLIRHRDSVGNSGSIGQGEVQWMTAAGGIMHEEMPQVRPEGIRGFQLWVNLPAALKMTRPRYQGVAADEIPEIEIAGGSRVKIIAGALEGTKGPVAGIAADPAYLDVFIPPHSAFKHSIPRDHTAFTYVFEGEASFGDSTLSREMVSQTKLVVWGEGDYIEAATGDSPVRFLLVSAQPLREPVARYGPFVMNTRDEIEQALTDLRNGTFIWSEPG